MTESDWFSLSDHSLLTLEGRDAVAFAQAQCMNDVQALAVGEWQWSGWLTPKGRVIALFALLRPAVDTVWLVVPDAQAPDLAERLRRFVFRSKVAIAVRDDLHLAGHFPAAAPQVAERNRIQSHAEGVAVLDVGGDAGARSLRIGPVAAPDDADALARWRSLDLRHGWPRLDTSQREQWTPQQLSLERLRAFSVKKGCYPGQEIVARTHFLGQAKRGLALVDTATPAVPGAPLNNDAGEPLGSVVSAEGPLALAVLPLSRAETPRTDAAAGDAQSTHTQHPTQGGASWRWLELAGGMER